MDKFELKKDGRFGETERLLWNILEELKEIKELLKPEIKPEIKTIKPKPKSKGSKKC